jgi:hypothetical protein
MRKAYIILIICLAAHPTLGQNGFQLAGRVVDSAGVVLVGATIQYTAFPDTVNISSGDDGRFVFRQLKGRKFKIAVTMKGYCPTIITFSLPFGKTAYKLPVIVLGRDYLDLDPVIVSRIRPITITEDTVSYHVGAFPVRDGSAVEDILKRLPGIEVDIDGNVIVQGKKLEKVLVNGKEFFGGDVLLAIQNLPAEVVDKLQIVDDYGDKARLTGIKTGDPAKVLNIVLKAEKRNGRFGHGQLGAGNDGKYVEDAFANNFQGERQVSAKASATNNNLVGLDPNGNGSASYADQWTSRWGGGLNTSVGGDDPETHSSLSQQTYYPGQQLDLEQGTVNNGHNRTEGEDGIVTYKPDPHVTLRITPTFGGQQTAQHSAINATTLEQDSGYTKTTVSQAANSTTTKSWNSGMDLYFERIFPTSKQRLSIQANVHYINNRQLADDLSATEITSNAQASRSILHYLIANNTPNLTASLQSNYYLPTDTQGFIELGYNTRSAISRADRVTKSLDSLTGNLTPIDSLTVNNDYRTFMQQLHIGYIGRWRGVNWSVGLDG